MNSSIKHILAFSAGVAVGVAASWRYLKNKYEQKAQEAIDDVKEKYGSKRDIVSAPVEEKECPVDNTPTEKQQYDELAKRYSSEKSSEKIEDKPAPYVITPEEFGEIDEYDTTTLYYYVDGVLVTLEDEIVEDVAGTVGEDFASHFGEFEDDSVVIRNDSHKCDYEILRDLRRYSDVKKPARSNEVEE